MTEGLQNFSPKNKIADQTRGFKEAEIQGVPILFDLTASTQLKQQQGFPNWLHDLMKFNEIIFDTFREHAKWFKFLGDAYLFFFPDKDCEKNCPNLKIIAAHEIIDFCENVMNDYWNYYKIYSPSERGAKQQLNFRQITCAIDYGGEIINWWQFIDTNYSNKNFDPIGPPIDRCFRISKIAGPGQILVSKNFYAKKLDIEENQSLCQKFEKISIKEGTLRGFPAETEIYYLRPPEEQIEYILDEKNVELVETAQPMTTKVKMRLLRNKCKN